MSSGRSLRFFIVPRFPLMASRTFPPGPASFRGPSYNKPCSDQTLTHQGKLLQVESHLRAGHGLADPSGHPCVAPGDSAGVVGDKRKFDLVVPDINIRV